MVLTWLYVILLILAHSEEISVIKTIGGGIPVYSVKLRVSERTNTAYYSPRLYDFQWNTYESGDLFVPYEESKIKPVWSSFMHQEKVSAG